MASVKIKSNGKPGGTSVTLDGKKIPGVVKVEWAIDQHERSTATIIVAGVEIDAEADALDTDRLIRPIDTEM